MKNKNIVRCLVLLALILQYSIGSAEDKIVHIDRENGIINYDKAMKANKNNNDKSTFKYLYLAAKQGVPKAQGYIASMYDQGVGVTANRKEAVKWFKRAAESGLSGSQYYLAVAYHEGDGVTKDFNKAVKWLRKSAEQNYPDALGKLAHFYFEGIGVKKDSFKGRDLMEAAAMHGHLESQFNLAKGYLSVKAESKGSLHAYAYAYAWFRVAKSKGHKSAEKYIQKIREVIDNDVRGFSNCILSQWVFEGKAGLRSNYKDVAAMYKDAEKLAQSFNMVEELSSSKTCAWAHLNAHDIQTNKESGGKKFTGSYMFGEPYSGTLLYKNGDQFIGFMLATKPDATERRYIWKNGTTFSGEFFDPDNSRWGKYIDEYGYIMKARRVKGVWEYK